MEVLKWLRNFASFKRQISLTKDFRAMNENVSKCKWNDLPSELKEVAIKIQAEADGKVDVAFRDYETGARDCRYGFYDKWYRYHRSDDGYAYDLGWMKQNEETKNDEVKFIEG